MACSPWVPPWTDLGWGDRPARRITSGCGNRGHRESDSRLLEQLVEELLAGVYEGVHGRGEVSGVGGIDCGEILVVGVLPLLEGAGQRLADLRGEETRLDEMLLEKADETAVPGGIYLTKGQPGARRRTRRNTID